MADALLGEHPAEKLVLLDGHGAHQHRLALFVALLHLADHRPVLPLLGFVHGVLIVNTDHRAVGGDLHNVQLIDGGKLLLLGHGRTGHAGELAVQAEVILEGDGGQGLALPLDGDVLLGLDGLVQALGIPAAEHQAAGELVHDDDLAVLDHIVHVPLHGAVSLDGLVDVVGDGAVLRVGEVIQVEELLGLGDAPGRQGGGAGLFVHDVVGVQGLVLGLLVVGLRHHILFQAAGEGLGHVIQLGGFLPHAGDDQGGPGLIDQDGVHLVHDGEAVAPLDLLILIDGHVVPQVIKAHLIVGAVGNVGGIGGLALLLGQVVDDQAHGQAHEAVDLAHPLAVALGQIVVDGDDMDAVSGQGVEIGRQGGHQGLAFTGFHLGDASLMQDNAADELHPIGAQAQHPVRRLPDGGKGLRQDVVQGLALLQALLELRSLGLKLFVGEGAVFLLQSLDLVGDGVDGFQLPLAVGAEDFLDQSHSF